MSTVFEFLVLLWDYMDLLLGSLRFTNNTCYNIPEADSNLS
jgi:hypothetical protein